MCVCGQENISLILSLSLTLLPLLLAGPPPLSLALFFLYFSRYWAFTDGWFRYPVSRSLSTHTLSLSLSSVIKRGPNTRVNKIEPWLSLSWRGQRKKEMVGGWWCTLFFGGACAGWWWCRSKRMWRVDSTLWRGKMRKKVETNLGATLM